MKLKAFILSLLFSAFVPTVVCSQGNPEAVIENFDLRYYHPQLQGLNDLYFEIKISNLKENVLKNIPLSKLDELYYSVYWIRPGKFHIEVNGLPSGYLELRRELKALVKNRLDFVLPQKLSPKVRSYALSIMKPLSIGSTRIKAVDKTQQRSINLIEIEFDRKGKLQEMMMSSSMGKSISKLEMSAKSWSKNKWVMDSHETTTIQGIQETKMSNKIYYKSYSGFGFPEKVVVTTTSELKGNIENKKTNTSPVTSEIYFLNYKINKGVAKAKILGINIVK